MKIASLSEIKKELNGLDREDVLRLCLRLAGYKKENKELLNYLLFEAGDEAGYINHLKEEVCADFEDMNLSNLYLAKKSIRRVLRILKKHIKYSGNKETEVDLLIYFCEQIRNTNLPVKESKVLYNLYLRVIINIEKAMSGLHEDIQYDYLQKLDAIR